MKFCKTDKEIVFSEVKNQFLTVVCANLMAVAHGGLMGWFSPAILLLQGEITEIAEDHVRGILGSMLMIFANIGIMMSYLTGFYMDYHTAPLVMMLFPIGLFLSFLFIPDTPMSLLERNKSEDSIEKSLKFYLNMKDTSTEHNKSRFETALQSVHAFGENKKNRPKFSWKELAERNVLVGFGKSLAMVFFSIFCGSPVLQNYSSKVFKDSGSKFDHKLSAIIMIVIQVTATVIATSFVDNVGRRLLLIVSAFGTAIGLTIMATFNFLHENGYDVKAFQWVPVASISFTVLLAYIGLLPLVFVIIMEVLPAKVRERYATICLSFVSLFMFIVVKVYPLAVIAVKMYGCMWLFAFISFLATLFGIFVLDETKGKDINEL